MPQTQAFAYGDKRPRKFNTIDDAFEEARYDKNVWKISWMSADGEYVCFIRIAETRSKVLWAKIPLSISEG